MLVVRISENVQHQRGASSLEEIPSSTSSPDEDPDCFDTAGGCVLRQPDATRVRRLRDVLNSAH